MKSIFAVCVLAAFSSVLQAKTVVFWQPGFPTVASEQVDQASLRTALSEIDPEFADISTLNEPETLSNADLLVLPYGSAVPADAWKTIQKYLETGGNLLLLGGEPLHVPVSMTAHGYEAARPQDSYARVLGLRHVYEVPMPKDTSFTWRSGYNFGPPPQIRAKRFFAVEGRLNGLGYMKDSTGQLVAAPVIVIDHANGPMRGSRSVALDFTPEPGYWSSPDGVALIRQSAAYARQGATLFSVESLFSLLRPGESPQLSLHLLRQAAHLEDGEAKVELLSNGKSIESITLRLSAADTIEMPISFHMPLAPGFYQIAATYTQHQQLREFYQNGIWVSPPDALQSGPSLGVHGDFLTRDGVPFFPVGTNYFTTEENGWDFSGPRNAAIWEKDFAEMEAHGVSFVRTGVWMPNARFIDGDLGGANERFLRNLEAYLLSAQRHKIAVNFTFFAFSPKSGNQRQDNSPVAAPNPFLNRDSVRAQQAYVRSVVERFRDVPWLSWDLINEPSFSNPAHIFKGNYPNNDPDEIAAWHNWLRQHYVTLTTLADAWSVTPEQLGAFDNIPLPSIADLNYERYGNPAQVRALDYNLFAQDSFTGWVRSLVSTIRNTGSIQLIDVGQDEGGVTDRVLNQFYANAGVSFTTNHTYWRDDALLWDSVVAKRPGMPNITGETGYQPAWAPDGTWRYDELTGLGLTERKWALGFADGSSGAMQWDWAREVDFGMQRSDGSAKLWENMMRDFGRFSAAVSPHATALIQPQIAIVIPQSMQMSVLNSYALEAQQNAVRALYQEAHGQAYAVGEYQIDKLGDPKLILLPSPMGLTEQAWSAIEHRIREGATLLVTGPFDGDAHLHPTHRQDEIGLHYTTEPLGLREQRVRWPGGDDLYTFGGQLTTVLMSARLDDGKEWDEVQLGKGNILFSSLPLELGANLQALGRVYSYGMQKAKVSPDFTTAQNDPGILICPTSYPDATLYVLTSETQQRTITFRDSRSGKNFSGDLAPGRAAMLLVETNGRLIASYHWSTLPSSEK
ncbi:beta-galactosidase [Granulicella sp. S190]|uniref:beta-galactosidase n=1 Tax=Granulicella sp. S190 TaxID=1747226 RepID=UPI00131B1488|nr:beta-galactosidase [Granulicella sp. S190]